ncbi:MAG TPA: hypothetical protein VGR03_19230 [Candidatus Acidoferrum sp.]|nr:hypothetical protein [Candidatus Acidoferrum sp.]
MPKKPESGDLRSLLATKLGVTERQVYNRAKELANRASLKPAEAIWLLAAQSQINLSKYLPPEVVDRVRGLLLQIPAPPKTAAPFATKQIQVATKAAPKEFIVAREFKGSDPILSSQVLNEAREMAAIYPLLYVVENSMREFIRRIVDARLGVSWWTTLSPTAIRRQISTRMTDEKKNAWHQRRGNHPIDYLDLIELPAVVRSNELKFIPDFLPTLRWFEQFVEELYQSRCVVCHMNPLEKDNIQDVKLKATKWQKHVKEKKDTLP